MSKNRSRQKFADADEPVRQRFQHKYLREWGYVSWKNLFGVEQREMTGASYFLKGVRLVAGALLFPAGLFPASSEGKMTLPAASRFNFPLS